MVDEIVLRAIDKVVAENMYKFESRGNYNRQDAKAMERAVVTFCGQNSGSNISYHG